MTHTCLLLFPALLGLFLKVYIYILRLRKDKRSNRKRASLATSPRIATGTFSRMEEMEDLKPMPWLGPALTKITKPKCN